MLPPCRRPTRTGRIIFQGVHHVALLCASLERSLDFYCGVLGLEVGGCCTQGCEGGSPGARAWECEGVGVCVRGSTATLDRAVAVLWEARAVAQASAASRAAAGPRPPRAAPPSSASSHLPPRPALPAPSSHPAPAPPPPLRPAQINPDRPHDKLPYRGAWLWIGPEMIHLMVGGCWRGGCHDF